MAWTPFQGSFQLKWRNKKASQVLALGAAVSYNAGQITVGDATAPVIAGICMRDVLTSDSDYAEVTRIPVQIPSTVKSTWLVSVLSTDTATAAMEGTRCDLAGTPVGIDVTVTGPAHDIFTIEKVISANSVTGYMNGWEGFRNGV